jgi:hypothetical protein
VSHPWFEDLSPYEYQISPYTLDGVLNVGWINPGPVLDATRVGLDFLDRLKKIACGSDTFRPLVETIRTPPECAKCGKIVLDCSVGTLPEGQFWIPESKEQFYASPIEIIHYVEAHGYVLPADYVNAVMLTDMSTQFDGDALYRTKLQASEWFRQRFNRG